MKQSEIKDLTVAELQEKLSETKKSLSELKMAHAISPLDNPIQIRNTRRVIAKIATELTKRDIQ